MKRKRWIESLVDIACGQGAVWPRNSVPEWMCGAFRRRCISFANGLTDEIKLSIEQFHDWLRKNLILTKNLIPHNLVLKRVNNDIIIKIVDGLGSQAFIPLPDYSNFFAKRYVERRIKLMMSRIKWDLSGRVGSWK